MHNSDSNVPENGGIPANPVVTIEPSDDVIEQSIAGGYGKPATVVYTGLTKREHFAGLAPQMPDWYDRNENIQQRFFTWRVYYADALLKELDK